MTVAQLIAALVLMPQDAIVLTNGYEGGFDRVAEPETRIIRKRNNPPWFEGDYDDRDDDYNALETGEVYVTLERTKD